MAQAADAGPWQKAAPAAVEGRDRLSLCFGGARGVSPHQVHLSKGCDLGAHRGPCAEGLLRPLEDRACSVLQFAWPTCVRVHEHQTVNRMCCRESGELKYMKCSVFILCDFDDFVAAAR